MNNKRTKTIFHVYINNIKINMYLEATNDKIKYEYIDIIQILNFTYIGSGEIAIKK